MLKNQSASASAGLGAGRLFSAAPEALLVLRGNVVAAANDRMAQLAGRDPTGLQVHALVPEWRAAPDSEVPFEAVLRTATGGGVPVEVRVRALGQDESIVAVRDARELVSGRRAEAALAEAETRYRTLAGELTQAEARVALLAYHDALTGLANRELFEETLTLAVERAKRDASVVAVLSFDLDNFKLVNESLGHHTGDLLLVELAERLRESTRDTDLVARQGGDEFLILLADLDRAGAEDAVRAVAARVELALSEPFDLRGVEFHARGSTGISMYPRDALDVSALLKNADIAMYRAKRIDPGGHTFFAADADDAVKRMSFALRLREAVEDENWVLHYQPVVDLSDRRIVGAEALIRWNDARGILPPGEFISAAEELGLIEAIGDWVIEEVARQQREWLDEGLDLDVSFNLSPRQLWTAGLVERLLGQLDAAGVAPSSMTAEITESTAMIDPDRTQRVLRDLHAWGLRLAIDDFGTGYSSLARLKHMPVDVLKIDREFVRHVDRDVRLAGMVRAMIQVAQSLDMVPLAEGIETKGEYLFLRSNGCRFAQGFWFARPVPGAKFRELVARGEPLGLAL